MNAPPDRVEQLCWEIRRAFRELATAMDIALAPLGVGAADRALLEFLAREEEPVSLSELARKMAVSRQHIHQALRRLPRSDWIEARPSPDDRRAMSLRLTDEGRVFWRRLRRVDQRLLAQLAAKLSEADVTNAIAGVRCLRARLDEMRIDDAGPR